MRISAAFQNRFKELAGEAGIDRTRAAQAIGITYVTFSKIYNYGIVPKVPVLIKLADFFSVSVDYLLGNTENDRFTKADPEQSFQTRLIALKERKELRSFYELSDKVHIHKSNISQWLTKNYVPELESLEILAEFFDVSLDYLLGRSDDEN